MVSPYDYYYYVITLTTYFMQNVLSTWNLSIIILLVTQFFVGDLINIAF